MQRLLAFPGKRDCFSSCFVTVLKCFCYSSQLIKSKRMSRKWKQIPEITLADPKDLLLRAGLLLLPCAQSCWRQSAAAHELAVLDCWVGLECVQQACARLPGCPLCLPRRPRCRARARRASAPRVRQAPQASLRHLEAQVAASAVSWLERFAGARSDLRRIRSPRVHSSDKSVRPSHPFVSIFRFYFQLQLLRVSIYLTMQAIKRA